MQTQIFTVDESQIDKIARRNFLRTVKIVIPTIAVLSILQYLQYKDHMGNFIIMYFFVIPFIILIPMYFGAKKATKSMRTLELILTDGGVEKRAEMAPYRKIAWQDLAFKEKPNGTLDIYDKNVPAFMRWWNGAGRILLPPEMVNREILLRELHKYAAQLN